MPETINDRIVSEYRAGELLENRSATVSAVPTPRADVDSLQRSVKSMKTWIDQREGSTGSVLDKFLTLRDLLQSGTIALQLGNGVTLGGGINPVAIPTQSITSVTATSIDGGGGDPGYVDPRPYYATPPTPTNLVALGAFRNVILTWDLEDYINHSYTEIWRSSTNALGTAVRIGTSDARIFDDGTALVGGTYYYWVRAVNVATTAGAYNAVGGVSAALLTIGNTDLGAAVVLAGNLASNSVTPAKIQAGAIDFTKFASGLEPVAIVGALPSPTGYTGSKTVLLTTDGKLYRYAFGAWTKATDGGDIVSASITSVQIAGHTITAGQIAPNTVTAVEIAGNTITAGQIASNTITATQIASNTITAGQIAANTITAGQIAANTITAGQIAANTITAGQIQAGAIGTTELAAGAVTTGKLLVTGNGAALNSDPSTQDIAAWVQNVGTAAVVTLTDGKVGQKALRLTAASGSYAQVYSTTIACSPGKTYRLSLWGRQPAGGGTSYFRIDMLDAANAAVAYSTGNEGVVMSGAWTRYRGTLLAPATANTMRISIYAAYPSGGVSNNEFQDIRVEEASDYDMIVDGAIIATKLAANSIAVGTAAIQNGAIVNAMIGTLAVDDAKIANLDGAKINAGSITAAKITAGTITATQIQSGTITATQIQSSTITAAQIASHTITAAQIAANTITANEIAANTITANEIASNAVTAGKILAGSVDATKISVSSLSAISANMGTITAGTLAAGTIFAGTIATATLTVAGNAIFSPSYAGSVSPFTCAGLSTWQSLGITTASVNPGSTGAVVITVQADWLGPAMLTAGASNPGSGGGGDA